MAEAVPSHSTAPAQNRSAILTSDASASSSTQEPVTVAQATPPANLALRQSRRHTPINTPPRIQDITEKFTKACSSLKTGQLVKDEYFTLFESIGAIEIMDPKMDSGFLKPGETLEDEYDCLVPLLPEELLGIMDQLLCYEMAWHTGYPLSQTLFTSLHIDRLLSPETKIFEQAQFYRGDIPDEKRPGPLLQVLRAYCLALIKGCDFVIAKIAMREYFEEEDFCTHTYNRVLFVSIPIDVFLRELDAAIDIIGDPDFEINEAFRSAILSRLEFRKSFLQALDLDLSLGQVSHTWPRVMQSLSNLKTTHQLGQVVPGAFSTKMQRRLASTVPPRPIVELDFKDAMQKLEQLCTDSAEATRFIDLQPDPLEYQSFLWYFASRSPAPLVYSRSYLATILFHPDVLQASISLPLVDVKTLVFPASPVLDQSNWAQSPPRNPLLPKPPRLQLAMLIDEFVDRSGQPYLDFWVALCQNRCRTRRVLTHVITAWDMLQSDASSVDADLAQAAEELGIGDEMLEYSLSTWVYLKKLWMIEKIILLSFEQDIYLPDEYGGVYLFLSLIATRRKELLKRVEAFYIRRGEQLFRARKLGEAQDLLDAGPYLDSLIAEAEGTASLSLALARVYIILLYLRLLPIPKRPFSTEQLRYELRMKPFLSLQPPEAPPFDDFKEHTQPYGDYAAPDPSVYQDLRDTSSPLWQQIDAHLKSARDAFADVKKFGAKAAKAEGVEHAWGKDVQSALASCIALGVAIAGIKGAVAKNEGLESESLGIKADIPDAGAGKRYAEGWIVVKIVKE